MDSSEWAGAVTPDKGLALERVDAILDVVPIDADVFLAGAGPKNHQGTVFGGRLLAQALCAASRTVEALPLTSLHAYFLAPGLTGRPLEYRVARLRDSRRFANRQVTAHQGGQPIFTLMCQFHAPEEGFAHQFAAMPDVPPPEDVVSVQDFVRSHRDMLDGAVVRNYSGALPVEIRPLAPEQYLLGRAARPQRDFWFRMPSAAMVSDARLHHCLLAFASDYWLNGVSAITHTVPTNGEHLLLSSLDHALWFHAPVRCDDWLLHHTVSPAASDGLALSLGQIFDRSGRLIASTAQEGLLRARGANSSHT
jgi:acyl-CoA thioesterase II